MLVAIGNGNIKSTAELVNPYGIQVSNAAEYMPSNFVNDYGTYLPDDLIETYKFWKSAANYYNTSVDNLMELNSRISNNLTIGQKNY